MAIKGSIAKDNIENKLREVFGADFVDRVDSKLYVNIDDGGNKVQICLAMSCPKTPLGVVNAEIGSTGEGLFDDYTPSVNSPIMEITDEEKENIKKLMAEFGL